MWFSFDNGLMGITKDEEFVSITSEIYLPSLLIYTLNSDEYGNLLVGSNKGVTVIAVDNQGKPESSNTYNRNNGFYGYETHMRSRSEEHTSELQSRPHLVCRLLLEKKKKK